MATNNTRQTAWVAIGSFFSFIVGIASPMILSRYFDKGDYGTYKQVMYVYNTMLIVFSLGLPKAYAYFIPRYPINQSKDIINKITRIFWVLGGLFSIFLFLSSNFIAILLNNPDLNLALKYFSPVPLLLLPTLGLEGIYSAFRKTFVLTFYIITTRLLTITMVILPVVILHGTYTTAIFGFVFASFITCIIALVLKSHSTNHTNSCKTKVSYKEIFNYSLPLLFASIWGIIISSANQFFISRYFGKVVFAEFSNGFMEIPLASMVLSAVATVLLPVFSGMAKDEETKAKAVTLWENTLIKSAKIIFPILIFSIFYAHPIMTCMYGDQYSGSSIYFQIKNASSLMYIIPFAPIMMAIGKTKEYALVHMVIAVFLVISELSACEVIAYLQKANNQLSLMWVTSAIPIAIISELFQAAKIYLMLSILAKYFKKNIWSMIPKKELFTIVLAAGLSTTMAWACTSTININKYILLIVNCGLYCIIYYGLCWVFKISYRDVFRSFTKSPKAKRILTLIP